MKKHIFLTLFAALLVFSSVAYAALPDDIINREYDKFQATPGGKTSVLVTSTGTAPSLTAYFDGRTVVATAGTAVPLNATTLPFSRCTIQALEANTNDIVIGASTVDETTATRRGILLVPTASYTFDVTGDLLYIYIDSAVNGEGVEYFCQQ